MKVTQIADCYIDGDYIEVLFSPEDQTTTIVALENEGGDAAAAVILDKDGLNDLIEALTVIWQDM